MTRVASMGYFAIVLDESAAPLSRVVQKKGFAWRKPHVLHVTIKFDGEGDDAAWRPDAALVGKKTPVQVDAVVHSNGVVAAKVTLQPDFLTDTPHITLAYAPPFRSSDSRRLLRSIDFRRRKQQVLDFGEVLISLAKCTVYGRLMWMECASQLAPTKRLLDNSSHSSLRVNGDSTTPQFVSCQNSDDDSPDSTEENVNGDLENVVPAADAKGLHRPAFLENGI
eukprot:GEMP01056643.1.p1 GENE.GEMP01056643.1~~GEMP01056643.1.p1  ORF type:complete len:223 (+),score=55.58 GEMP01056643.1:168-836(+)